MPGGGIGINVAGAFRTIGASGIVLDDQLWLMPESPLTKDTKKYLRNMKNAYQTQGLLLSCRG